MTLIPKHVEQEMNRELKKCVKEVCEHVDLKKPSKTLVYMIESAFLSGAIWKEKKMKAEREENSDAAK